ncbi:Ig-like domain-containing protein [Mycetocola sp. JXN-3]|uniref:Ig-like domain-containing protein n=1 Tax=Mycetocola sp. JXN-3 TaxID=2116510 RepID=UPI00165D124E|nr:Ig-like domain-containing protein [Mycetocola sp. JXN-3]
MTTYQRRIRRGGSGLLALLLATGLMTGAGAYAAAPEIPTTHFVMDQTVNTGTSSWESLQTPDGRIFIANSGTATLTEVAVDGTVTQIPVLDRPFALDYDSATGALWVAHSLRGVANVTKLAADGTQTTYSAPGTATSIAVNPINGAVYVGANSSSVIGKIAADGTVTSINLAAFQPTDVVVDPVTGTVWAIDFGATHNVFRVDPNNDTVVTSNLGIEPATIGFNPRDGRVWIGSSGFNPRGTVSIDRAGTERRFDGVLGNRNIDFDNQGRALISSSAGLTVITADGAVSDYSLGEQNGATSDPEGAIYAAGADGTLSVINPDGREERLSIGGSLRRPHFDRVAQNVLVLNLRSGEANRILGGKAATIVDADLVPGTLGVAYRATIDFGGDPEATLSLAEGSALPAGMTLAADGTLAGTPTAVGTFTFTLEATNALRTHSVPFTLVVAAVETPVVILTPAAGDTQDRRPVVSGTGVPGATVTLTGNGAALGTVPVGDDGTWTFTPETDLALGEWTLSAAQSANTSTSSVVITVVPVPEPTPTPSPTPDPSVTALPTPTGTAAPSPSTPTAGATSGAHDGGTLPESGQGMLAAGIIGALSLLILGAVLNHGARRRNG